MKGIVIFLVAIVVVNCEDEDSDTKSLLTQSGFYNENQYGGDNLKEAIKGYQRKFDLLETGVVDQATKKLLHTDRCGMPDVGHGEIGNAGSSKWDKTSLTFSFKSYTRDLSRGQLEKLTEKALNIWGDVTPLEFSKTSSGGDIVIEFLRRRHGNCEYPFNGPGGVLAHAYFPGTSRSGQVHFDDDEHFTMWKRTGINYLWVATHEFGHTLGLRHDTSNKYAVMYPYIAMDEGNVKLHENDKYRIQSLYGKRGEAPKPPRPVTRAPKVPEKKRATVAPTTVCRDLASYCHLSYLQKRCKKDKKNWMLKNCAHTCGFCIPNAEGCIKGCQDHDSRCGNNLDKCKDPYWIKWQQRHCAKACGFCCKA